MSEVLECQLLVQSGVRSKNSYTAVGIFAKGIFRPILHIQRGNVFQQAEEIVVKQAAGSSALALCPGLAWVERQCHSPWAGPGSSQLLSSASPTDIKGILKPSTEVCGLGGKTKRCSK